MYIDGFNLYFGLLKAHPECRWLDIEAFVKHLVNENEPSANVISIKYFTARIKRRLSPRGADSQKAQNTYLQAIRTHSPIIEIIEGKYFIVPGCYFEDNKPIDFGRKHQVLRPEEKRTDVNIALHMLADATDQKCEQQVLLSNDSDCAPILEMINKRHPDISLGVIPPIEATDTERKGSKDISAAANWVREPIQKSLLLKFQLPEKVQNRKRALRRPEHWNIT